MTPVPSTLGSRLAGEVAVVTGSTRGIGRAVALRFAQEGARVVVTGRSRSDGARVEERIRDLGAEGRYVPMDISREEDVRRVFDVAVEVYGKVSVLVNNAAPMEALTGPDRLDGALHRIRQAHWERVFGGIVNGVLWSCRYGVPVIREAGGGAIVNVSSLAALLAPPAVSAYSAAKAAVLALTRSTARDGGEHNIRCNALVVGMIAAKERLAGLAGPSGGVSMLPIGAPLDVANAALFLASREAAFVTGASVPVDGGASCFMPVPPNALDEIRASG